MKVTVFGATGDVGRRVVDEALMRGHEVTAVARSESKLRTLPPSAARRIAEIGAASDVAGLLAGQDLAISALRPPEGQEAALVPLTRAVVEGAAQAGVPVLVVGGAASLRLAGQGDATVLTAPGFLPDRLLPIARACQAQYEFVTAEQRADWRYLCPPAMLTPGLRTGRYRVGSDTLLADDAGDSAISMEDFAVALLDEAETPRHSRQRFTVAY